ncbi:amino acid permease [Nocardioides sp. zg-579]|uniref:Amino acid permease n=1 Tax=Nocardioides marmotae TaxID=2663857 RepID=A0A6I3JEG4_9ACTN|nr:APC family permease [Nocardioides marmotae]MCR6032890.1 amino acid permease [Gordonia jinghuaiqii]MTB96540.1 amino acid permease [Nocardioides marmotae]QKE01939.1 APC family permease [Nocardioides marmotae]
MAGPHAPDRSIGTLGLTFVAVGGVVGSGVLFAPLFAAQEAGPAAVLAWPIAGLMLITVALVYAEIAAMLPVVGGLGLLPTFSHGQGVGIAVGWVAWVGYVTAAPIETQAMLEYASNEPAFDWLFVAGASSNGESALSLPGVAAAVVVLAAFTALNAFGVALFTRVNSALTWVKVIIPVVIAIALLTSFSTAPIRETGFAPDGATGVMSAITSGGVVFAFLGFRHALDLAGEARRPQVTIPVALVGGILICTVLFTVLQLGFIGAVDPGDLGQGWAGLEKGGANGPLAALLTGLGMTALAKLVVADAVLGPFGAGLVSTASTGRLAVATAQNGLFPHAVTVFNRHGVPLRAMVLNLVVGVVLLLAFRDGWSELLSFNSGAIVLSMCLGPVTVLALRRQVPDRDRPFRLPAVPVLARVAFVVITLIIYWTGWETMIKLTLPIAVGIAVLLWRIARDRQLRGSLALGSLAWLGPYYAGVLVLTFLGRFGGGREVLPAGVDMVVVTAFALVLFEWGMRSALPADLAAARVAEVPLVRAEPRG